MEVNKKLKFLMVLNIIFAIGCQSQEKKRSEKAENFLKKVEYENIAMLYDLVLIPRKYNSDSNKYQLGRFVSESYVKGNREQIDLPVITKEMRESEMQLLPFYNNIYKFAAAKSITIDSAKKYIVAVTALYEKLNIVEVISHPDLGRFIAFKINSSDELIYKEEDAEVYHEYWKNYFKRTPKFGNNWYFRVVSMQE